MSYLSLETTIGPARLFNPPPPGGADGAPVAQPGPSKQGIRLFYRRRGNGYGNGNQIGRGHEIES